MEYKKFGKTDFKISRIAFGCWAVGGHGYGVTDDQESIEAIRMALDMGINFFDTADVYGFGHSEEILSKALGKRINDVVVATKVGVVWDKKGEISLDCSSKRITAALDQSLKRLRLDCIPLYQIHWFDEKNPLVNTLETLEKCRQAGKIRYIGCTNFTIEHIRKALKTHRLESWQCIYNVIDQNTGPAIGECAVDYQMGTIAYEILGRGLLTGKYGPTTKFGLNDTRNKHRYFQNENLQKNLKVVNQLGVISKRYGKNSSQLAIRFALDHPHVSSALVGIKNRYQLMDNLGALSWSMSLDDRQLLYSLNQST